MGRDLWRAIGAGQIRFKDLNEQDKKKVLEYGIQTKQINTNTLTNRAWQLLKQSPDFALSKVRESTAESLSIESTPQRTDYLSKARDVVKNIFTQPTTRTTVRPPVIEGTKYQLLNMNDLKKTGGAITVRTPDGKEKSQFTNVVIDGKEVPSYVAYAMMKAGRKIDSVLANPQRVTTVLDRGFIQVNPTTFVNRFTGELIMSDKPVYDYDTGEATLRAPTTTERIKTGLSEAEQKAKRAAEQLAQGISKGVLLPEIMSAVGPKTPEGERMYKPEDFTRPSETWLEQTAESVGGVLPYVMAGPVAGAAEAGLAKAIPALTKNIAGQILSRAAGRAALGVAVKGAQTAGKALLDTDYLNETSVRNILSELTDDALIMASFGAASKAVGEPLGVALSKALPKAFEPGLRGLATRAGIIGTRGFVSGAIGAVPSEAIKILKDPDKFDIKESSLNVLSTGIRFAVMDLAMGLKPNPPMFRLSWKVGTNNKVIAKPVVDFTQSIDVKKGYVSAGNGVWIKQTQDKGGIINREIVMQLTIDKDGILKPMASSAKETSEGMLSLPEKAAAKEKATITQRAAIEEKASKAAAQIVPKGTKPLKFNRVQSSYIKDGKTIEASGLQYKDYTIFDPKYGKRIVAKDGQIIAEADSFQEAKSIVADILEREPEDKQIKVGKSSKAKTERGTTVDVSFAVVNADDLITSHDTSLKVNPNYPQELQPRDRSRIASEFQIEKIAKNIEPEFLGESPKSSDGAPIVGDDLVVESGNARVIALNRAYDYGTAKNYKQWLLDSAEQFGLNKDEIARMEKPVLVRIRQSDVDRVKFAQEANESSVATMSATEQAMTDAQKLDSSLLSQFYPTDDGNILNAQNRDFISRFLDKVVGPAEKGNYITKDGSISQDGVRRIQNAIFAKAYGDTSSIEKLAESTDSNIKNITNSMLAVAPRFVELKEAIRKGNLYDLDITSDISQAATKISSLRETGMKVEVYLRQTSLLEEDISDLAKDLLDIFDRYKRSSKKITSILQAYADAVETLGHPEQAGLFATTEVNKAEVLDAVLRRIEEGEGEQTSFFQDETRGGREDTSDTERKSERGEAQKPAETTGERLDKPKTKDKGDIEEKSPTAKIAKKADLEPPARTSRSLDDIVESNVKDVYEDLKGKSKQLGIMAKAFRANTDRKAEKAVNDSVEQVLESTGVGEKLPLYLRIALGIKEGVEDVFIFEPKLRDFPRFRNEVRLFKGVPKDAREFAAKSVYGIVGNLPKEDFEVFRKIIALRDIVENGTQGLRLPLDIPLEEYQEALDYYEEYAKNNSDLQKALDKHKELMESIAYDLVERGKLDEGSVREYYYPHRILGWERLYDAKGMPIRIRTPARRYTKQRTGSAKLIEMDYVDVVLQHITRVYIDNAIDDFAEKQAKEYDMMKEVKKDKKLYNELFGSKGPQPNQIYEIDGERYVAWQYNPGNAFYNALTITEKAILDAIAEDKSVAELVEDKQIKKALAVGRKHKMYLLPEPIAEKLSSFRKPKEYNAIYKLATEGITQWKRMVLGFAGLPYHLNNIIGDALNLYREDPVAFTKFFESISALRGSEKHKELVKLAKQHRVIDSGFFSTFSSIVDGKIAKQLGLSPGIIGKYEQASTFRENILRLAKFMKDMERIQSGKQVVTKSVEIKGLTPEEAAGKIAREALVDYQAISERMQSLRQFMFPFATFYVENTKSWFKYVTKNPKDMFLKFIIPAILMYIWNVIIQKDVEDELPDYFKDQFHINTGYRKVNGDPIIISFETPIDLAAKMIGLDKLPESITDILSGKKLPKEVGIEQLKYSILAPGRETFQLLNPLVKSGIEIAMNKNVFIGSTIVPARLKGTPEESKIKTNYFIQNVLSPYGHYVRVTRDVPPTGDETLFEFLFKGPLDFKRALGIREIDSEKIRINKIYEAKEKAETKYNQYRNEFEKAVISYSVEGDIEILRKAVDKLQDKGFGVTRDDFNKALEKPRVQREIVMKLLRKTRDKAERERLEAVLKDINRRSLEESLKTTPVKTRKDIIDEAGVELRKLFK